jgi:hypothetical protein
LNKIPLDSAKAGAALKLLNGDVKDVGTTFRPDRRPSRLGDDGARPARIKSTRAEVKKLGEEFTKTGDIDVFKKLSKASGDLSSLTGFRKTLSNSIETGLKDGVEKGGPEAARTFSAAVPGRHHRRVHGAAT